MKKNRKTKKKKKKTKQTKPNQIKSKQNKTKQSKTKKNKQTKHKKQKQTNKHHSWTTHRTRRHRGFQKALHGQKHGDARGIVEHALAKHNSVQVGLDVQLGEQRQHRHRVGGTEDGATQQALDKRQRRGTGRPAQARHGVEEAAKGEGAEQNAWRTGANVIKKLKLKK